MHSSGVLGPTISKVVEQAILELNFPPEGFMNREVADELANVFQLSDNEKRARANVKGITYIFRDQIVLPTLRRLLREKKIKQPLGSEKSYVLADIPPPLARAGGSIEEIYQQIRRELATELLQQIKENSPAFFEKLVIDLLVKMGYGGSREDAGRAVGGSRDGGIDGIINEDRLGLDVVYIQAKRWEGDVSRPEIQRFAGHCKVSAHVKESSSRHRILPEMLKSM